jgi:DNA-binding LytR/AlgR family response regulator
MIKILLIEDEEPAARRLWKLLKEAEPTAELLESLHSVKGAIEWLGSNPSPDLIVSDIQLSDGISFEIFRQIPLHSPIIFTTAFDQHAIEAFKVNSIDYLLKPIKKTELELALKKFRQTITPKPAAGLMMDELLQAVQAQKPAFKKRFVVRYGEHIKSINTDEIAYFYTEVKVNFLQTFHNRRYIVDINLDSIESVLDPVEFFRINRQFIISINSIAEMFAHSKSRVLVHLNPPCKTETIVSTERSSDFKLWLDDSGF